MCSVDYCAAKRNTPNYKVAHKASMWKWQIPLISGFTVQSQSCGPANFKKGREVWSCLLLESGEVGMLREQTRDFPHDHKIQKRTANVSCVYRAKNVIRVTSFSPHNNPKIFYVRGTTLDLSALLQKFQAYKTAENSTMNIYVSFMWIHHSLIFCYIWLLSFLPICTSHTHLFSFELFES